MTLSGSPNEYDITTNDGDRELAGEASTTDNKRRSPGISVLLPVWNEAATIATVLDDLARQTFQDFEVIIVDGGSVDGTVDVVRRCELPVDLVVIEHGRASTPEQLNAALAKSRGRFVARVDGHLRLPPEYLETLHGHLLAGYAAVGVRKTALGTTRFGRALAACLNSDASTGGSAYHHERTVTLVDHVPYAAYDRTLVDQLGGWDERLLANQDAELDQRVRAAGGEILLDGSISTLWLSKNTPRDAWRQYRRYGRGRAMTARLHRRSVRPRHVVLAATAVATPGLVLASVARRRWGALVLVHPLLDLVLAVREVRRVAPSRRVDPVGVALSAFAMYLTQLAWGTSFAAGVVDPTLLTERGHRRRLRRKQRSTYA